MPATRSIATLELVGNALCLDFANTLNVRPEPQHDYLATAGDLVDWAEHAGAVDTPVAAGLRAHAEASAAVVRAAHRLREAVHATFSAVAAGRAPDDGDLAPLLAAYADAVARATLRRSGDTFALAWLPGTGEGEGTGDAGLGALLHPVAASAVDLLRSPLVTRVKECPGCGWLFVDLSRNRARRWCSMQTCGSRDKMRRLYRRQRAYAGRGGDPARQ
ncbi:MAG TPA: ABATE domain-containing protein [Acidimicrobiales bacterium]